MSRKPRSLSNKNNLEAYEIAEKLIAGGMAIIILSIPFYWFLSGLTLNYSMRFWLGVANNGEQVSIPAWPGYVGGGFLGGTPILVGGVTYIIDQADLLVNDPFPN